MDTTESEDSSEYQYFYEVKKEEILSDEEISEEEEYEPTYIEMPKVTKYMEPLSAALLKTQRNKPKGLRAIRIQREAIHRQEMKLRREKLENMKLALANYRKKTKEMEDRIESLALKLAFSD